MFSAHKCIDRVSPILDVGLDALKQHTIEATLARRANRSSRVVRFFDRRSSCCAIRR